MPGPWVLNPDDFLRTEAGRVYTEERNAAAWERLYLELESRFLGATPDTRLLVVMGVQGSGKTTWIRSQLARLGPATVCLDAALPARRHRARAVALARRFGIRAIAVWINVPLETALERNAGRPADEVVPESAIRSVFGLLEAPTVEEGFDEVIEVTGSAPTEA